MEGKKGRRSARSHNCASDASQRKCLIRFRVRHSTQTIPLVLDLSVFAFIGTQLLGHESCRLERYDDSNRSNSS